MQPSRGTLPSLIRRAQRAAERRSQRPTTAHLLLALLETGGAGGRLLEAAGVDEALMITRIAEAPDESHSVMDRIVERARGLALARGATGVSGLHLLFAIAREQRSSAFQLLSTSTATPGNAIEIVRSELEQIFATPREATTKSHPRAYPPPIGTAMRIPMPPRRRMPVPKHDGVISDPSAASAVSTNESPHDRPTSRPPAPPRARARTTAEVVATSLATVMPPGNDEFELEFEEDGVRALCPTLLSLGHDLSCMAEAGGLDPVIRRDAEIDRLVDVLNRRSANNPMVVGPSGVGKTALVHGLVQELQRRGDSRIVVELTPSALVAGTGVRGAMAQKMDRLFGELESTDGEVIVFIDDIHALFSGATDSPDDLAGQLKSALGRNLFPCIGVSSSEGYARALQKDPALARCFTAVPLEPPTEQAVQAIVEQLLPHYEDHHGLSYDARVVAEVVPLTARYVPDRNFPDKALTVIDLAGARARRQSLKSVDHDALAEVVSELSGVPAERLRVGAQHDLLKLESSLARRIVGHQQILANVCEGLRCGVAGLRGTRPLGVFLFLGPTGVGKTELAKAVADELFGGAMTRLDMSEFCESHAVSRVVGAPPGYVGHESGGQLTEAVRRRPYQVVLLDEIEKAHLDVWLSLLPVLDEGHLTDSQGRRISFQNTVIFMTSNLGVATKKRASMGFGVADAPSHSSQNDAVLHSARSALPPELWNRIDDPLVFSPLTEADARQIALRMLAKLQRDLHARHEIAFSFDDGVIEHLVQNGGFSPEYGARPMRRTIGRLVENPVATALLEVDAQQLERLHVRCVGGGLSVQTQ